MSQIELSIDDSAFPIVVVLYPTRPTIDSVQTLLDALTEQAAKGRFAMIADLRPMRLTGIDATLREYYAKAALEWMVGPGKGLLVARAVVLHNPLARMFLTAHDWRKREGPTSKVFSNVADANRWCEEQLAG